MKNTFSDCGRVKAGKTIALTVILSLSLSVARAEDVAKWRPYPSCSQPSTDTNATPSVPVCLTGELFHLDGSVLPNIVASYVCGDDGARAALTFDVRPPQIAVAMYEIASKAMQKPSLPEHERQYVAGQIEGYEHDVSRARPMYGQLLAHAVAELELNSGPVNHPESAGIRESLTVPSNCSHRRSEEGTKFTIAIATTAIQRFSSVVWRDATDSIARGNKLTDLEAAQITVPPFVLKASIADSVARIYPQADGKPLDPNDLTEIDIIKGTINSKFSVPLRVLPSQAQRFLALQSSDIARQIETTDHTVTIPRVILVPQPQSIEVFPHEFWVEHVMWQVAARSVVTQGEPRLDRSQYQTYGLH